MWHSNFKNKKIFKKELDTLNAIQRGVYAKKNIKKGKILNKKTIFSERVNGEFKLRRDFKIKERDKVLIVEDVITTGKSSMECSKLITLHNANVVGYACIIDRSNNKSKIKGKIVSQVELNIPTYSKDNLPEELLSIEAVKPGSRNLWWKE